jgi:hypothetical protein
MAEVALPLEAVPPGVSPGVVNQTVVTPVEVNRTGVFPAVFHLEGYLPWSLLLYCR